MSMIKEAAQAVVGILEREVAYSDCAQCGGRGMVYSEKDMEMFACEDCQRTYAKEKHVALHALKAVLATEDDRERRLWACMFALVVKKIHGGGGIYKAARNHDLPALEWELENSITEHAVEWGKRWKRVAIELAGGRTDPLWDGPTDADVDVADYEQALGIGKEVDGEP